MLKNRVGFIKLYLRAGLAKSAPPVSSMLGQRRLNVPEFCKQFNELTKTNEELEPLCVKVYVYSDRSYDLIVNAPTLTCLVKKMLSLDRCASRPGRLQVGVLTRADIALLAARKSKDMSAASVGAGIKCVAGSLRSMGISVER
ncbi:putative 50S ribosomal subunit protein L11 [Candidatus Hodgkinia cicadicola]|nr:putative 50S ribosomal subunit protein L11 [Candidatus Hodgkinia cicadicola]